MKTIDQAREDMELAAERRRDYFAAHAPPVPEWFKPVLPERPKMPEAPDDVLGAWVLYRDCDHQWPPADRLPTVVSFNNVDYALTGRLMREAERHDAERSEWAKAVCGWDAMVRREILLQWPWWHADQMIRHAAGPCRD